MTGLNVIYKKLLHEHDALNASYNTVVEMSNSLGVFRAFVLRNKFIRFDNYTLFFIKPKPIYVLLTITLGIRSCFARASFHF